MKLILLSIVFLGLFNFSFAQEKSETGKGFSIVSAKALSTEEAKAWEKIKQLELDPAFKAERKKALEFLKTNQSDELRKDTAYLGPIEDIFEPEVAEKPNCGPEAFKKIRNSYPLSSLILLKRQFNSLGNDVSIARILLKANFDRLGREGKLNNFPRLNTYFANLKIVHPESKDLSLQKFFEIARNRQADREKAIRALSPQLTQLGVSDSSKILATLPQLSPECFTIKGIQQFEELLEKERMSSESLILLQALKSRYEREGKIRAEIYDLAVNKEDPIVQRRDAWGTAYLLQLTEKELILRSLGPDKMLSADDVNLGSFPLKPK